MSARDPLWRRYMRLLGPDPVADLDDELQDHLASTEEALVASGMSAQDAREEARRRFGDVSQVRRTVRSLDAQHFRRAGVREALGTVVMDVRYASRMFRRSPLFTLVAALSIAIGVAANATAFALVNAVLLRPLPGTNTDALVRVYTNHHSPFAWETLDWFRSRATSFAQFVGERSGSMAFRAPGGSDVQRVRSSMVTQGFFRTYHVPMTLGRGFDTDDRSTKTEDAVMVLSHAFWQRTLGSDSSVVGRSATLAGTPVTIIGVMAPEFSSSVLGWSPQVIVPVSLAPQLLSTRVEEMGGSFYSSAQLRDGVSMGAATAELDVLMRQLAQTDTARYARTTVRLDHMRGLNAEVRATAAIVSVGLMGMVGFVLIIACANVANLLVGRSRAREMEIGVRLALGATRKRLIRQLLTESLMLALLGALVGLALTYVLTRALVSAIPPEAGLSATFFAPDVRVLLFTGGLCVVTTLLFGLLPALRAASPTVSPMLRGASVAASRKGKSKLIALQAGLCVVLLAVASQFGRSMLRMQQVDNGFNADDVVNVAIDAGLMTGDNAARHAMYERVLSESRTISGVTHAAMAAIVPLTGSNMETVLAPEGIQAAGNANLPRTRFNVVSDGYFAMMEIPLSAGRAFDITDRSSTERVAVINETAARRWWPGVSPLGKRFRWGGMEGPLVMVAGVAKDAAYDMPGEDAQPFVYLPLGQEERRDVVLQLRTTTPLPTVRSAVFELLRVHAPTLPPPPVTTMRDDMAITILPIRVGASALAALGLVALLLAASGIYGVTAFAVTRRTKEIGIRTALGATRTHLLAMVLRESLRPVVMGAIVGMVLATAVSFGLAQLLYGIEPFDPVVIVGIVVTLTIVAVGASLLPAWRATKIEPVTAIRGEG